MINLNIKERLLMATILPKESDIKTMTICKDIAAKTDLTQSEFEEIGFTTEGGAYSWSKNIDKQIEFTEAEIQVVKEALKKLDDEKKITRDALDIYYKFNGIIKNTAI